MQIKNHYCNNALRSQQSMAVAATTVKENRQKTRPSSGLGRRRCERKQTPRNRVRAMRGRSWGETVEAANLLSKQILDSSKAQGEPMV